MAVIFVGTSPNDSTPIQWPYFRIEKIQNQNHIIVTDTIGDIGGLVLSAAKSGKKGAYKWKSQLEANTAKTLLTISPADTGGGNQFYIEIKNDGSALQNSWNALTATAFTTAVAGMNYIQMNDPKLPRAVILTHDAYGIEYGSNNPMRDFRERLHIFSKLTADYVFIHIDTTPMTGFLKIYHT